MNSELAALAARLTVEFESAEAAHREAQARLREVQAEIARVRDAAKLLNEPDPFAEALQARRREGAPAAPAAPKPRAPIPMPVKATPRAHAEALFSGRDRSE